MLVLTLILPLLAHVLGGFCLARTAAYCSYLLFVSWFILLDSIGPFAPDKHLKQRPVLWGGGGSKTVHQNHLSDVCDTGCGVCWRVLSTGSR